MASAYTPALTEVAAAEEDPEAGGAEAKLGWLRKRLIYADSAGTSVPLLNVTRTSIAMRRTTLSPFLGSSQPLVPVCRRAQPSSSSCPQQGPRRLSSTTPCLNDHRSRRLSQTASPRLRKSPTSTSCGPQKRQFTSTPPLPYKSIQEARSRYRSGVSQSQPALLIPCPYALSSPRRSLTTPPISPSPMAPPLCSSGPARDCTSTSSTKKGEWSANESRKPRKGSGGRRSEGNLSWWIRMGGRLRIGI